MVTGVYVWFLRISLSLWSLLKYSQLPTLRCYSLHVTNFRKIRSFTLTFSDFSSRSQWHLADTSPITSANWRIIQKYFILARLFLLTESFWHYNIDSFRFLVEKCSDSFDFALKILCVVHVTRALIGWKNTTRVCRSNQICFYFY